LIFFCFLCFSNFRFLKKMFLRHAKKALFMRFCKKRKPALFLKSGLLFLIFFIFCNIFQLAADDAAKLVQSIGTDVSVFTKAVKLAGAYAVVFYKWILRNAFFFKGWPKLIKNYHWKEFLSCFHFNDKLLSEYWLLPI